MDLDLGSKETETLIQLLYRHKNGCCKGAIVEELIHEGYSQTSAYNYANRVLEIQKVFATINAENAEKQKRTESLKSFAELETGAIFGAIDCVIKDNRLNMTKALKAHQLNKLLHGLAENLKDRLDAIGPR